MRAASSFSRGVSRPDHGPGCLARARIADCRWGQASRGNAARVLERAALPGGHVSAGARAVEVAHEPPLRVALDTVAQDVVVHPPAHVDGVDLDVAVVGQRGRDIGKLGVEVVHPPQEPAGVGRGQFPRAGHGPEGRVGWALAAGAGAGAEGPAGAGCT